MLTIEPAASNTKSGSQESILGSVWNAIQDGRDAGYDQWTSPRVDFVQTQPAPLLALLQTLGPQISVTKKHYIDSTDFSTSDKLVRN